jgi:hypothetical protein
MAHFAEVDESNMVLRVLVVPDEHEHRGQEYMADDLGLGGTWIQTSYNTRGGVHKLGGTPSRYNFAGAGSTWDEANGAFIPVKPFPSWTLADTFRWTPPIAAPEGTTFVEPAHAMGFEMVDEDGEQVESWTTYDWDENTTSWVEDEVPE